MDADGGLNHQGKILPDTVPMVFHWWFRTCPDFDDGGFNGADSLGVDTARQIVW